MRRSIEWSDALRPWFVVACLVAAACGDDGSGEPAEGTGGTDDGGAPGTSGGASSKGGNTADGGSTAKGGTTGAAGTASGEGGAGGESGAGGDGGAAPGGAPTDGGALGEGGAGGAPEVSDIYVDPEFGDDENPGTITEPVLTLEHAATLVSEGSAILLLPGTFSAATEPLFAEPASTRLQIPDGVALIAAESGTVTLENTSSGGIEFLGSGAIDGIAFDGFAPAIVATSGTLDMTSLSFDSTGVDSCGSAEDPTALFDLSGTVQATWFPGDTSEPLVAGVSCLVRASEQAQVGMLVLTLTGGVASDVAGAAMIQALDEAQIDLDSVEFADNALGLVYVTGSASALVTGGSVLSGSEEPVRVGDNASFELSDESLIEDALTAITIVGDAAAPAPTVSVIDASLLDSTSGIGMAAGDGDLPSPTIVLDGATITGMAFNGLNVSLVGDDTVTVTITDSQVFGNGLSGVTFDAITTNLDVTIRNSEIRDNTLNNVYVRGADTSNFDFGRGDDPGGNTFTGPGEDGSGLLLNLGGGEVLTVYASGNNWEPNEQGANAEGHFDLPDGETVLDVTDGEGPNYRVVSGGAIRVAEDPCVPADTCP